MSDKQHRTFTVNVTVC